MRCYVVQVEAGTDFHALPMGVGSRVVRRCWVGGPAYHYIILKSFRIDKQKVRNAAIRAFRQPIYRLTPAQFARLGDDGVGSDAAVFEDFLIGR